MTGPIDPRDAVSAAFTRRVLTHVPVAARAEFSRSVLARMEVDVAADAMTGRLIGQLRTFVQAEHLAQDLYTTETIRPATWRDHRRLTRTASRWRVVRWLGRRRPVRYVTGYVHVRVDRYQAFPESDLATPLGAPVTWEVVQGPSLTWRPEEATPDAGS